MKKTLPRDKRFDPPPKVNLWDVPGALVTMITPTEAMIAKFPMASADAIAGIVPVEPRKVNPNSNWRRRINRAEEIALDVLRQNNCIVAPGWANEYRSRLEAVDRLILAGRLKSRNVNGKVHFEILE